MPSAAEHAYAEIRKRIVAGQYEAGTWLREEQLSDVVGVSRTPVREALRLLHAEGLVEFLPQRGAQVASWSDDELREIFDLRALLESHGAKLAATSISADALDRMDVLADGMEAAGSRNANSVVNDKCLDEIAEQNNELHRLVLDASGSPRLIAMLKSLVQVPLVHRTFRRYPAEGLQRSFAHHRELIAALRARDGQWASSVMRSHIMAARNIFVASDGTDEAADGS